MARTSSPDFASLSELLHRSNPTLNLLRVPIREGNRRTKTTKRRTCQLSINNTSSISYPPTTPQSITPHSTPTRKYRVKKVKRRLRTFYSKKWGNQLFLTRTTPSKSSLSIPQNPVQTLPLSMEAVNSLNSFEDDDNRNRNQHLTVNYHSEVDSYYESDSEMENSFIVQERKAHPQEKLKIVVSAPDRALQGEKEREDEKMLRMRMKSRRMKKKRRRRRRARNRQFYGSDLEEESDSSAMDSCYSSDSSAMESTESDTENTPSPPDFFRMYPMPNNAFDTDSDTDYLSAQSDDLHEVTICYGRGCRQRNIRFRAHGNHIEEVYNKDCIYLSDLGQSDIGSSDTECYSDDSMQESGSVPPPVHMK